MPRITRNAEPFEITNIAKQSDGSVRCTIGCETVVIPKLAIEALAAAKPDAPFTLTVKHRSSTPFKATDVRGLLVVPQRCDIPAFIANLTTALNNRPSGDILYTTKDGMQATFTSASSFKSATLTVQD